VFPLARLIGDPVLSWFFLHSVHRLAGGVQTDLTSQQITW